MNLGKCSEQFRHGVSSLQALIPHPFRDGMKAEGVVGGIEIPLSPVLQPHIYRPDWEAMGDCAICGHVQNSILHVKTVAQ